MKIRFLLPTLTFALALPLGLNAQAPGGGKEPETELGKHMEKIGPAFRRLSKQIKDASKNEDSLKAVATIKENATAALKLEPAFKAKQPPAEQAKFVAAYQSKMKDFLGLVAKLEEALKANDNEKAAALCAQMNDTQKEGHKNFRPPQKKKG